MKCAEHSSIKADYVCLDCHGHFCQNCVKKWDSLKNYFQHCLRCRGRCVSMVEIGLIHKKNQLINEARDFWTQLGNVFLYPFNFKGMIKLLSGVFVYVIFSLSIFLYNIYENIILEFCGYFVLPFIILASIGSWLRFVEVAVVSDDSEVPDWPNLLDFESWFFPTVYCILAFLILSSPAIFYWLIAEKVDFVFYLMAFAGFSFLPIILLIIVLNNKFSLLVFYEAVIIIKNTFWSYVAIVLFWALIILTYFSLEVSGLLNQSFLSFIIRWFLFVYFLYITARPLGVYFRANEECFINIDS